MITCAYVLLWAGAWSYLDRIALHISGHLLSARRTLLKEIVFSMALHLTSYSIENIILSLFAIKPIWMQTNLCFSVSSLIIIYYFIIISKSLFMQLDFVIFITENHLNFNCNSPCNSLWMVEAKQMNSDAEALKMLDDGNNEAWRMSLPWQTCP